MKKLMSVLILITVFNIYGIERKTAAPVTVSSPPWESGERGIPEKVSDGAQAGCCRL